MAAKTSQELQDAIRLRVAELQADSLILIRENKRSLGQIDNLARALQLFKENRLGIPLSSKIETPSHILEILSQRIEDLVLHPEEFRSWARAQCGDVEYVGELFGLHQRFIWASNRSRGAKMCRELLGKLDLNFRFKPDSVGWIPPYMTDGKVAEFLKKRKHELSPKNICTCAEDGGCASIGEFIRGARGNDLRWHRAEVNAENLREHGLRLAMFVPKSWEAPPMDPEACKVAGKVLWDGSWILLKQKKYLDQLGVVLWADIPEIPYEKLSRELNGEQLQSLRSLAREKGLVLRVDPSIEEKLNERVDNLSLSVRTSLCFQNEGIHTLRDLVRKTEAELLRGPNFGRRNLNEVKEVLAQMGLDLGMEV